jgi:hypothetical protein
MLMPDAQTMLQLRVSSPEDLAGLHVDAVQMDPPDDDISDEQLREAHRLGLILPSGLVMMMTSLHEGTRRLSTPPAQQRLLLALEAALGLLDACDIRSLGFHSQFHHIHTHQGQPIHLILEIPADPTALLDFDHLFITGFTRPEDGSIPLVAVKTAKRDAVRLAEELADIDSLLLSGRKLWAIKDGHRIGWLDDVSAEEEASWREHSHIHLMISAGGAKRQTLYIKNILSRRDLPLQVI